MCWETEVHTLESLKGVEKGYRSHLHMVTWERGRRVGAVAESEGEGKRDGNMIKSDNRRRREMEERKRESERETNVNEGMCVSSLKLFSDIWILII